MGHHLPARHWAQVVRPEAPLYLPPLQGVRRPPTQYSPGAHCWAPDLSSGASKRLSGLEYHPVGTAVGAADPGPQYRVASPQGVDWSTTDPTGQ